MHFDRHTLVIAGTKWNERKQALTTFVEFTNAGVNLSLEKCTFLMTCTKDN
jgi:hypothetical protein